jgi:hypothetical protein
VAGAYTLRGFATFLNFVNNISLIQIQFYLREFEEFDTLLKTKIPANIEFAGILCSLICDLVIGWDSNLTLYHFVDKHFRKYQITGLDLDPFCIR